MTKGASDIEKMSLVELETLRTDLLLQAGTGVIAPETVSAIVAETEQRVRTIKREISAH
jgi:hypothetical protein